MEMIRAFIGKIPFIGKILLFLHLRFVITKKERLLEQPIIQINRRRDTINNYFAQINSLDRYGGNNPNLTNVVIVEITNVGKGVAKKITIKQGHDQIIKEIDSLGINQTFQTHLFAAGMFSTSGNKIRKNANYTITVSYEDIFGTDYKIIDN